MPRTPGIAIAITSLLLVTGCHRLRLPSNVTRIEVKTADDRTLKKIDSSADIKGILTFVARHQYGWQFSESGVRTPPVELSFYARDQRVGRFGISCGWYFVSDMADKHLFTYSDMDASDEDVRALLSLLGLSGYHFEGEGCQ